MDSTLFQSKVVVNTIVKLIPLGFYLGTLMMGVLFTDVRAFILFIGYVINELISLGFRHIFQTVDNPTCAIAESSRNFFTLPSSHTQTVAFTMAFFFTEMYTKNSFNPVNFVFLAVILLITMWSRINVGCEDIVDAIYAATIGILIGAAYYRLTETWGAIKDAKTLSEEKSVKKERETEIYQRT